MNVFLLSQGQDTGGQAIRIKAAFNRYSPGWNVRSMHVTNTYIAYPADLHWNMKMARELWDWADVAHGHNTMNKYDRFGWGKPFVLHHHGTIFRENHAQIAAEARRLGVVQVASTLDLTLLEPDVTWVPAPYPLPWLAKLRTESYQPSETVRIAHAPTNRLVKSTEAVIAAVAELRASGLDVELDLIENTAWHECLARKAQADIYVDQVKLGYGCNAVEAWGMGIPVVANAQDPAVLDVMRARFGELPFFRATEDNLAVRLRELVTRPSLRAEYAERGRTHVERFHDERVAVELLRDIYSNARPTRPQRRSTIPTRVLSGAERRALVGAR